MERVGVHFPVVIILAALSCRWKWSSQDCVCGGGLPLSDGDPRPPCSARWPLLMGTRPAVPGAGRAPGVWDS